MEWFGLLSRADWLSIRRPPILPYRTPSRVAAAVATCSAAAGDFRVANRANDGRDFGGSDIKGKRRLLFADLAVGQVPRGS